MIINDKDKERWWCGMDATASSINDITPPTSPININSFSVSSTGSHVSSSSTSLAANIRAGASLSGPQSSLWPQLNQQLHDSILTRSNQIKIDTIKSFSLLDHHESDLFSSSSDNANVQNANKTAQSSHLLELQKEIKEEGDKIFADLNSLIANNYICGTTSDDLTPTTINSCPTTITGTADNQFPQFTSALTQTFHGQNHQLLIDTGLDDFLDETPKRTPANLEFLSTFRNTLNVLNNRIIATDNNSGSNSRSSSSSNSTSSNHQSSSGGFDSVQFAACVQSKISQNSILTVKQSSLKATAAAFHPRNTVLNHGIHFEPTNNDSHLRILNNDIRQDNFSKNNSARNSHGIYDNDDANTLNRREEDNLIHDNVDDDGDNYANYRLYEDNHFAYYANDLNNDEQPNINDDQEISDELTQQEQEFLDQQIEQQQQQLSEQQQLLLSNLPKPCVFFLEGNCRRSDCKYSHDLSKITCKYWIEGFCFKGEMCPFLHSFCPEIQSTADPVPNNGSNGTQLDSHDKSSPNGSDRESQKQNVEPNFTIESETDFPSLPLDHIPSTTAISKPLTIEEFVKANQEKRQNEFINSLPVNNSNALYKMIKKKRKRG